jgi:16S rRNA pseudouridine516 synthase
VTLGRYHLVKRMLAAVGNRVESLHRVAIGGLVLPPELRVGEWMWLEAVDLERLAAGGSSAATAGGLRHGGHAAMEGAPGSS